MTPSPTSFGSSIARFAAFARRLFIAYARWLDSISWRRFIVLSLLALIAAAVLSEIPPFSTRWGEDSVIVVPPQAPKAPAAPRAPTSSTTSNKQPGLVIDGKPYEIVVDDKGVRIGPKGGDGTPNIVVDKSGVRIRSSAAASGAGAAPAASDASATSPSAASPSVTIRLPDNADKQEIRDAIEEARNAIEEAVRDAAQATAAAEEAAAEAAAEAAQAAAGVVRHRSRAFRLGDHLPQFVLLLIVLSVVTKIMAAGRFKAEAKAEVATEMAESEALKRQVVEARMAAMQAQVEPHFLFNTLASIDHLIETDPPRASKMQKNLIALLRASMPSMREANAQGTRDLGRELAVIRPFLEILKVRMEDRLQTELRISDGLLSAEFPPMMLQGLVENAIKHGLEPKAEGGRLTVAAEIVHGKLAVTVADTGVGFGRAATAGTGIGLSNIRERLQLLYGGRAALTVSDNPGGGTSVTITVPYVSHGGGDAGNDGKSARTATI